MEISERGEIVLMIKMEPSVLMDIIKGCKITLIATNPNLKPRGCVLYIYDKPGDPIYFSAGFFGEEDTVFNGLDKVVTALVQQHDQIKLVLYNELNHPVHTVNIPIEMDREGFDKWLYNIYNADKFRNPEKTLPKQSHDPIHDQQGFAISLLNADHSMLEKMRFISPEYGDSWRQTTNSDGRSFKFDDYQFNGKHGNLQELSITSQLSRFFKVGVDLFPSPKYANGLEFTDYIIIDNNAALFFESKYVISEKQTKKHQAIHKAVVQLNKAEDLILDGKLYLLEESIQHALAKVKLVLKICLVNDKTEITDKNAKVLSDEFDKSELPIFVSLTAFIDLLVALSLKNEKFLRYNIFSNFIEMFNLYAKSNDKILYKNSFSVEGLSVEELNELGRNQY